MTWRWRTGSARASGLRPANSAIVSVAPANGARGRLDGAGVLYADHGELLRFSFHLYTTEEHVDRAISSLLGVVGSPENDARPPIPPPSMPQFQGSGNGSTETPGRGSRTPSSYAAPKAVASSTSGRPGRSTRRCISAIEQLSATCSPPRGVGVDETRRSAPPARDRDVHARARAGRRGLQRADARVDRGRRGPAAQPVAPPVQRQRAVGRPRRQHPADAHAPEHDIDPRAGRLGEARPCSHTHRSACSAPQLWPTIPRQPATSVAATPGLDPAREYGVGQRALGLGARAAARGTSTRAGGDGAVARRRRPRGPTPPTRPRASARAAKRRGGGARQRLLDGVRRPGLGVPDRAPERARGRPPGRWCVVWRIHAPRGRAGSTARR